MLTLLDELIEGPVRERMLISYLRYKVTLQLFVAHSTRDTKRNPYYTKCANYARQQDIHAEVRGLLITLRNTLQGRHIIINDGYSRIPISSTAINMIVGRLRSDDIYNQITAYPLPEHRSAALANQSSMLYIILYFTPDILQNHSVRWMNYGIISPY